MSGQKRNLKELKFSDTSFASFMILLFSQRIIFCSPELRRPRKNPLPCMNNELRGAIYRKHMLYAQYTKQRNVKTWEKFRQQRNLLSKSLEIHQCLQINLSMMITAELL
jgi:hypothetical protein